VIDLSNTVNYVLTQLTSLCLFLIQQVDSAGHSTKKGQQTHSNSKNVFSKNKLGLIKGDALFKNTLLIDTLLKTEGLILGWKAA
jgi:hypothetical protein